MTYGEIWTYRQETGLTTGTDGADLDVDTGPWIFGQKVVLPAGVISSVDHEDESVSVNRTKDEIKEAPPFDETTYRDSRYHDELGT